MPAYLYRSAGGDLTAPDRASAVSLLTSLGSSYEGQVRIVVAGETIGRVAWVGSAIEDLSGYERRDGGYGVVASVDSATQVTLAAGYTLGAAGRCRLWDVTGTTHLDSGGVEWRRSGAVVTLPDTTGLAAGDVIYSDRLEVTSYAAATALETALGTSFNGEIRLVNSSTGTVILRRVVRSGAWTSVEVNFANVTATPTAAVASVAGAVVTVTAPHTLATLAKVLRVQIVTDGTWSDVASGQWSVSGNDVTVPQATADAIAAALGGGKSVRLHVEGVSELCIGSSPCYVRPGPGAWAYFSGTARCDRTVSSGYVLSGGPIGSGAYDYCLLTIASLVRSAAADGQYAYCGVYQDPSRHSSGGTLRAAGADKAGGSYGAISSPSAAGADAAGGTWPSTAVLAYNQVVGGSGYSSESILPAARRAYQIGAITGKVASTCTVLGSAAGETIGLDITSCRSL